MSKSNPTHQSSIRSSASIVAQAEFEMVQAAERFLMRATTQCWDPTVGDHFQECHVCHLTGDVGEHRPGCPVPAMTEWYNARVEVIARVHRANTHAPSHKE